MAMALNVVKLPLARGAPKRSALLATTNQMDFVDIPARDALHAFRIEWSKH
jgi:hypothetical protein